MSGLVLLFASTASAREKASVAREQIFLARVTVYWASGGGGSDRYTRQHKCATGMRLRAGHCAVDPRKIPYGSQLVFPDRTVLLAVDTGTAVRNRKAARKAGRTVNERSAIVVDRFFTKSRFHGGAGRAAQLPCAINNASVPQPFSSRSTSGNCPRQSPRSDKVRADQAASAPVKFPRIRASDIGHENSVSGHGCWI